MGIQVGQLLQESIPAYGGMTNSDEQFGYLIMMQVRQIASFWILASDL